MSYSFSARGATLALALEQVSSELDTVVGQQPIHERDREAAYNTAEELGGLLTLDESRDVVINVNGSCTGGDDGLTSASIGVSISQVDRDVGDDEASGGSGAGAEAAGASAE